MQQKTEGQKSRYLLMVEDTASVAALYRSYLTPLGIDINIVGTGLILSVQVEMPLKVSIIEFQILFFSIFVCQI